MVAVRVNGSETPQAFDTATRVADLVELIKATIDPDHMITSFSVDGRHLEEHEWSAPLSAFEGSAIFEFETGSPADYVEERLAIAPEIVTNCYVEFREARKRFQVGDQAEANRRLVQAVTTARNFFQWFGTLTDLMPTELRPKWNIEAEVKEISEICKRICQQQLYQSWWAIGESIQKELEPKLDALEDLLRKKSLGVS